MPQSATIEKLTREGIVSLNKIWDEEGWTIAGIVEEMKKHGEQTSESTVQKMRKKGAENNTYNYNLTIKPMLRVFARISNEPVSVSDAETPQEVQIATLNNTILMREADIKVLEIKLDAAEALNRSLQIKIVENMDAEKRKISHLREQLADQRQLLDDRKEFMGERRDFILRLQDEKKVQRRVIIVLSIFILVLLLVIFAALIIDRTNPGVGFFWLDTMSQIIHGRANAFSDFTQSFAVRT